MRRLVSLVALLALFVAQPAFTLCIAADAADAAAPGRDVSASHAAHHALPDDADEHGSDDVGSRPGDSHDDAGCSQLPRCHWTAVPSWAAAVAPLRAVLTAPSAAIAPAPASVTATLATPPPKRLS